MPYRRRCYSKPNFATEQQKKYCFYARAYSPANIVRPTTGLAWKRNINYLVVLAALRAHALHSPRPFRLNGKQNRTLRALISAIAAYSCCIE
jgi:hypothetical protein